MVHRYYGACKKPEGSKMSIYKENGYKDRDEYLRSLADEYGTDAETVFSLASMLGEEEDFDGLVIALEDL
jgi:hypothetical protein